MAPVNYIEVHGKKSNDDLTESNVALIEEGRREEFYTEEHEKLLGSCEAPWTLFVDGYGKDNKRIYDPVKGKTCHQCRYAFFLCFNSFFSFSCSNWFLISLPVENFYHGTMYQYELVLSVILKLTALVLIYFILTIAVPF